ncbi:MAG TPA: sensor histidine kinase [Dehalococcoidia bacterium]
MEIIGAERPLEEIRTRVAALPSLWRRRAGDESLAALPGGIRLAVLTSPFIVRWASWFVALLIVVIAAPSPANDRFEPWLLMGTFVQTTLLTFYVPVFRPSALEKLRRFTPNPERIDVLCVGLLDLVLSMCAVYLSGGWGSPYFHFALTALLIPSFFLTFGGVFILAGAYMAAYVFGLATFGDGLNGSWKDTSLNSFIGALVTPLLVALVPNYLGNLLRELDAARQDAVEALADSDMQFRVARSFLEGSVDAEAALPRVAITALESSRFDRVLLLIPDDPKSGVETHAYGEPLEDAPPPATLAEIFSGSGARTQLTSSLPTPIDAAFDDCSWVAVVPLRSADAVEGWLLAGMHDRPSSIFHELRLLDAVGGQIALGVRNIRLSARVGELAAEGERTRIAREIHDGIAQMVYMLSLSLETAADRVGGDPEEQRRRLQDLTAVAKNALWEVRQYIFDLRPLLSGDEGLVGAIQGQVKEFQAVSDLPVELTVDGTPEKLPMETSAGLYRIAQEGLGNIFRHARASKVGIELRFADHMVTLAIQDDGIGISEAEPGGRVGHGMDNLQRRVEEMDGTLQLSTTPGVGTRIEVTVPAGGEE